MRLNKFILALALFFLGLSVYAHPWKTERYVLIDTDCGLDDFRAINILLASSSVRVLGIIASDGVVDAGSGYHKIRQLLRKHHHEGILIGINDTGKSPAKKTCSGALEFQWSDYPSDSIPAPSHQEVAEIILAGSTEDITFISLGSLKTIHSLLTSNPSLSSRIKSIVWTAGCTDIEKQFNYQISGDVYTQIIQSDIPLYIINNDETLKYSETIINDIGNALNTYGESMLFSFEIKDSPYSMICFDEIAALYIHYDSLFTVNTLPSGANCVSSTEENITVYIPEIVKSKNTLKNQVLHEFPLQPEDYDEDVEIIFNKTYTQYGPDEWQACVITSELHRHLGVYAITGAKMGTRAIEYFGAGIDELTIVSYAGLIPPFSCMNDGLQVSTGATLGHGLIRVASESTKLPQAEFTYLGETISIKLKDEYRKQIEKEIKELVHLYTLDSDIYWEFVRQLAIDYWKNWDRHEIFTISSDASL